MRGSIPHILLLCSLLVLAGCSLRTLSGASQSSTSPVPTAATLQPHAPKLPQPTVASCPMPPGSQTEILPRSNVDPAQVPLVTISNGAAVASSQNRPFAYLIIAGALKADPQQGVLVVISQPQDPCAQGPQGQFQTYDAPSRQGALTLTQIAGDVVSFTSAAGDMGQFNYISGQFL